MKKRIASLVPFSRILDFCESSSCPSRIASQVHRILEEPGFQPGVIRNLVDPKPASSAEPWKSIIKKIRSSRGGARALLVRSLVERCYRDIPDDPDAVWLQGFNTAFHEFSFLLSKKRVRKVAQWYSAHTANPAIISQLAIFISHTETGSDDEDITSLFHVHRSFEYALKSRNPAVIGEAYAQLIAAYLDRNPDKSIELLDDGMEYLTGGRYIELSGNIAMSLFAVGRTEEAKELLSLVFSWLMTTRGETRNDWKKWLGPNMAVYLNQFGQILAEEGNLAQSSDVLLFLRNVLYTDRDYFFKLNRLFRGFNQDWKNQYFANLVMALTTLFTNEVKQNNRELATTYWNELNLAMIEASSDFSQYVSLVLKANGIESPGRPTDDWDGFPFT